MSKADQIFLANCQEILSRGTWDTHLPVRPRWEDGTPAHTVKCFGLVNRYDLREEFPIQTIRRMYLKSAVEGENLHNRVCPDTLTAVGEGVAFGVVTEEEAP